MELSPKTFYFCNFFLNKWLYMCSIDDILLRVFLMCASKYIMAIQLYSPPTNIVCIAASSILSAIHPLQKLYYDIFVGFYKLTFRNFLTIGHVPFGAIFKGFFFNLFVSSNIFIFFGVI